MKLVMFDIDGTLIRHMEGQWEHYAGALRRLVPTDRFPMEWAAYPHITDSAILHHHFMLAKGRAPRPDEVATFQESFTGSLAAALGGARGQLRAVPGAAELLRHLLQTPHYGVAVASGGWRQPAQFKLRSAGLAVEDLPAAYAEDGQAREEIMRVVYHRALEHYACGKFEAVVYVGDAAHDVRASQNLGYAFIGVASGEHTERLGAMGACHWITDFSDIDAFERLLAEVTFVHEECSALRSADS